MERNLGNGQLFILSKSGESVSLGEAQDVVVTYEATHVKETGASWRAAIEAHLLLGECGEWEGSIIELSLDMLDELGSDEDHRL